MPFKYLIWFKIKQFAIININFNDENIIIKLKL